MTIDQTRKLIQFYESERAKCKCEKCGYYTENIKRLFAKIQSPLLEQ